MMLPHDAGAAARRTARQMRSISIVRFINYLKSISYNGKPDNTEVTTMPLFGGHADEPRGARYREHALPLSRD